MGFSIKWWCLINYVIYPLGYELKKIFLILGQFPDLTTVMVIKDYKTGMPNKTYAADFKHA